MVDERFPREHPNRGWNRASIMFWSRRPYRPRLRPEDVRLPHGVGSVRLFAMSVVAAACLTAVLVWTPLFFVHLFVRISGTTFLATLVAAVVVLTLVLFFWVGRLTKRDRTLAARM